MKTEASLFTAVAGFFVVTGVVYGIFSGDPAGTAALAVACLMSALIAFFLAVQARKRGARPEDRKEGEIRERAGRLGFFSAGSPWPPTAALGFALTATGVAIGLWLFLIGLGITAAGVTGFVFQYPEGEESGGEEQ